MYIIFVLYLNTIFFLYSVPTTIHIYIGKSLTYLLCIVNIFIEIQCFPICLNFVVVPKLEFFVLKTDNIVKRNLKSNLSKMY